ncbi:E3 ubiquitin-protein ligase ubr2 [Phytophthora pseudosyringae]|uniref:E3 ubiquitin-protein ligase ubr2 n=1 Tax=Phytophthora pseudosyringae TaxID=221518 RepID=A0A8T1VV01_9STRA|nr:E3 ubiquitin-protein ligase ubr2 [Phytophthora pseudosyringae]
MSRLVQIAQRSNKAPVGFKVQLVVHRLNANLALKHDAELVAVVMGRKKKIPTKPALYQPADPGDDGSLRRLNGSRAIQASQSRSGDTGEVVWGDMVAFSSTLYMAKSGLFQAKRFQIHVNTPGEHGKTVAVFEFDLAELVPLSRDSGKESVRLNTAKCTDDPRACISLTVVSSRVNRDSVGHDKERSYVDDSSSEMGSEMSAYTNHSRASSLASNCRHAPIPEHIGGLGEGKADAIRTAGHPAASDEAVAAADNARDELVKALQNLEVQLRESEAANVKLEATIEQKDREIERLTRMAAGIGGGSSSEDQDGVMQVDFLVYMTLKEQYDELKLEHEACQTAVKEATHTHPATGMYTIADVENEEESSKDDEDNKTKENVKDDASEASSANEYVDAEEPHLVAEVNALKLMLEKQRSEAAHLNVAIQELTASKSELETQLRELRATIEQKDEELQRSTAALQRAESLRNEVGDAETGEAEAQAQALETALSDNKRLEKQLLKFDGAMTAMEEEKARLLAQLRKAEIASAAAQEEVVKVQNALEQLESNSQALSTKLQEADQARELAEENVIAAEATIGTLQQQVRDVSTQLHETQHELETLREHQLTASSVALEEAAAKHQALERLWEDVKTENERLQARVEELEFRLAQSEANGEEKGAELQAQVDDVKREAGVLREELEALRASKTQIQSEALERELQLQEATETHRRISVDHDQRLNSEVMAREELLTRLQEQVQQTEKLSVELSAKVVALEQELDYFQGELIENKMKVAQLTQDNDELAIRNRHLEKDLASTSSKKK